YRLTDVTDGTTNTIMFAESAGGYDPNQNGWTMETWAYARWWSGLGMCPGPSGGRNCDTSAQGRGVGWALPGSFHGGGVVNIALADGSVRGLNAAAFDFLSVSYMAGINDAQIQSFDP